MIHLLHIDDARARNIGADLRTGRPTTVPGAVRLSVGLGTTTEDISRLIDAMGAIASYGAAWRYQTSADGTHCWPDPDPDHGPQCRLTSCESPQHESAEMRYRRAVEDHLVDHLLHTYLMSLVSNSW